MSKIAYICGYQKSNLYYYFLNKEAILFEIFQNELKGMIDDQRMLEKQNRDNPIQHLKLFIEHQLFITLKLKKQTDIMFDIELRNLSSRRQSKIITLRHELEDILFNIIKRGIESGVFIPVDAKLTTYYILSMIIRTKVWYSSTGRNSKHEIAENIFQFTLSSLIKERAYSLV